MPFSIQATLTTVPYGVCMAYFLNAQVTYICASPDGKLRPPGGSVCNGDSGSAVVKFRDGFWQVRIFSTDQHNRLKRLP